MEEPFVFKGTLAELNSMSSEKYEIAQMEEISSDWEDDVKTAKFRLKQRCRGDICGVIHLDTTPKIEGSVLGGDENYTHTSGETSTEYMCSGLPVRKVRN